MEALYYDSKVDRGWVETVQYHLMKNKGVSFALFMHRVAAVMSSKPLFSDAPACIAMKRDGSIIISFYKPLVEKLSVPAAAELLKHEILHNVFGHISSRGDALTKKWGQRITNIAMDLVINQHIDEKLLAKEGLAGVTIEKFKFPANLTTEGYCELLHQKMEEIEELIKKYGLKIFETFETDDVPDALRDSALEMLLTQVRQESKRRTNDKDGMGRGWDAGEALEFVEQVRRRPQVPWYSVLRHLEGKHTRTEREIYKNRPSRRHPAHWGRIRISGLNIWWITDTSGSMGHDQLRLVEPEMKGVYSRGAKMIHMHVDAGIAKIEEYHPTKGIKHFSGRGGTDFSPPFVHLRKTPRREWPDFLVYYTDGYGCVSQYMKQAEEELGADFIKDFSAARRPYCLEGIEVLWILAPGTTDPNQFRKQIPFGLVTAIPGADGKVHSEEPEDDDDA